MDRRAITLQRIQAFCAVYEHGSFSAAARMLAVSQPTVSKHLRDLEAALGMSLFSLEGGRVSPTAEADWLHAESRFLSDGVRALGDRIREFRTGAGQRLSVGCVGLLMHRHLPQALVGLRGAMPGLEIGISVRTALEQSAALRAGQLDVGFCAGVVEATGLHHRRIGRGVLVLVVPQGHALDGRAALDPAELSGLTALIRTPMDRPLGRPLAPYLAAEAGGAGQITCYSLEAMAPLARRLGLAAVVDSFTAAALKEPDLRVVPFDPPIPFDVHAIAGRPFERLRPALALTEAMGASLAAAPAGPR